MAWLRDHHADLATKLLTTACLSSAARLFHAHTVNQRLGSIPTRPPFKHGVCATCVSTREFGLWTIDLFHYHAAGLLGVVDDVIADGSHGLSPLDVDSLALPRARFVQI